MSLRPISLLLLAACGQDVRVNESKEAYCDGQLQEAEDGVVDGPFDGDGDGYYQATNPDCLATYGEGGLDCDDTDAAVHPGAADTTADGVDQDCSGTDGPDADGDGDGDGYVDAAAGGDDCDDADAAVHPGASDASVDSVDQDCDGFDGPDADGDAYADAGVGGDDCDDGDASVHPDAPDTALDGTDQDCDGTDGPDRDADGYVDLDAGGDDCDDTDAATHPGASDTSVDSVDQDCDGFDGPDADGDAYADAGVGGDDCDDGDASVHPGAPDTALDGTDQDCDGTDGPDRDADGYVDLDAGGDDCDDTDAATHPGAPDASVDSVDQDCDGFDGPDADGDGYAEAVVGGDDCDDTDASVHPGAPDPTADGSDQDCDGTDGPDRDADGYVDLGAGGDDCDDTDASTHPGAPDATVDGTDQDCDDFDGPDADADGYADAAGGGDDCDDADGTIHPGAPDPTTDGTDQDCDGTDGPDGDADHDGHRDVAVGGDDCDDTDPDVYPGAPETWDFVDTDCDGEPDRMSLADADYWWWGEEYHAYVGTSVINAGDLDADGYDDLVLGGAGTGSVSGLAALYVVPGGPSLTSGAVGSLVTWTASASTFGVGYQMDAGDINGDGYPDVVAGADELNADAGGAVIVLGDGALASGSLEDEVVLTGSRSGSSLGTGVGVGDVTGDGLDDVLLGGPWDNTAGSTAGIVVLIPGSATLTSGSLSGAISFTPEGTGDELGQQRCTSVVGDLDGDGIVEFALGAPRAGATDAGAVYLVSGASSFVSAPVASIATRYTGAAASDILCAAVDAGDVNADGYPDVAMSAGGHDAGGTNAGSVYLVLGAATAPSGGSVTGLPRFDCVGSSLYCGAHSGGGDIDADGFDEVLVSTSLGDDGGSDAGQVYVVFGTASPASMSMADVPELRGERPSSWAGVATDRGDFDGDGFGDILIGAMADSNVASESGAAYVVLGQPR